MAMRILFFTENFPPETNAAASRVYERACYWVKWGHEVTIVTCTPNFPEGKVFPGYRNRWHQVEDISGMRVVRVKTFIAPNRGIVFRTMDFVSFAMSGFTAGLFEKRPDVVVSTSPQFFAAVGGWVLSTVRRVPFVFELSDLWPASIAAVGAMKEGALLHLMEKLELFLYRRSASVVALTSAFKTNLVSRGIHPDRVSVVLNGVNVNQYVPSPRDEYLEKKYNLKGRFVIGYMGTHGMAHALQNVLDAAEQLLDCEAIVFLFVGTGAERANLVEEAMKRKLKNVVFVPPQTKNDIPRYWSLCDVALVHLKKSPVFGGVIPSKIFEAMAMGIPVLLSSPSGDARRIVEGEGAGVWIPPEDPCALRDAVVKLWRNAGLRMELVKRSLQAAPKYSRERQAREMLTLLESVSRNSRRRAPEVAKG